MDRRSLLAALGALSSGSVSGCLDTVTGGRFSGGVDPTQLTAQQGEVVRKYDDAVAERNDGIRAREDGIVAFNDESYSRAVDRFETAIEHFQAAKRGFSEAATLAFDIGEDEAGSICETAADDAALQIAATEAGMNAAEAANAGGTAADVNGHVEAYRDRLEQAEELAVEDPQALVDVIERD